MPSKKPKTTTKTPQKTKPRKFRLLLSLLTKRNTRPPHSVFLCSMCQIIYKIKTILVKNKVIFLLTKYQNGNRKVPLPSASTAPSSRFPQGPGCHTWISVMSQRKQGKEKAQLPQAHLCTDVAVHSHCVQWMDLVSQIRSGKLFTQPYWMNHLNWEFDSVTESISVLLWAKEHWPHPIQLYVMAFLMWQLGQATASSYSTKH